MIYLGEVNEQARRLYLGSSNRVTGINWVDYDSFFCFCLEMKRNFCIFAA